MRSLREPPGSSSPPQQFSCPLPPPSRETSADPEGQLPAASPSEPCWPLLPVCQGAGKKTGRDGPGDKVQPGRSPGAGGGGTMWAPTFEPLYGLHSGVSRQKREADRP